jgi:MFS family permease
MEKRLILSSFFSIASILFKIIPAMVFPVIIYYIFRKYGRKKTMMYIFSSILFFVLLIIPFIMIAGLEKTLFSFTTTLTGYSSSGTMSIYNIFKYISNIDIDSLSKVVLIAGYLVTFYLIIKHPLKDYEKELQRNILLVFICSVLLGIWITTYYMYFLFLFIFFLFGNYIKNFKRMKKQWLFGVSLTIISLILFSAIYRWGFVNYTWFDRVLLLVAVVLAPIGTFYSLNWLKKGYRNVWVLLVFAIIMFDELHAAPLVILPMEKIADKLIDTSKMKVVMELYGDHIDSKSKFLAYGIFYGLPALMVWIGLIYYYYVLLTEKYEKQENIT